MLIEHKQWFLDNILDKQFKDTAVLPPKVGRRYSYYSFLRKDVPFDLEFNKYLSELVGHSNYTYDYYHLHKWAEGCYFDHHIDKRENRLFGYVVELQESECKTKLLVEGKPTEEAVFNNDIIHNVPKIQKGLRISLTVFGTRPDSEKTML